MSVWVLGGAEMLLLDHGRHEDLRDWTLEVFVVRALRLDCGDGTSLAGCTVGGGGALHKYSPGGDADILRSGADLYNDCGTKASLAEEDCVAAGATYSSPDMRLADVEGTNAARGWPDVMSGTGSGRGVGNVG